MKNTIPSWIYRFVAGVLAYSLISGYLIMKIWRANELSVGQRIVYISELSIFVLLLIIAMRYYWRKHNENKLQLDAAMGSNILLVKIIIGFLVAIGYLILFIPIITKDIETWSISPVLLVIKIVFLSILFIRLLIVIVKWLNEPGFLKIGK